MLKGSILSIFIVAASIPVQAASFCSETFTFANYSRVTSGMTEVRTYQHSLPEGVSLIQNPSIIVNRKTGELRTPQTDLILSSKSKPENMENHLKAPEGYHWVFTLGEVTRGTWHYRLQKLGSKTQNETAQRDNVIEVDFAAEKAKGIDQFFPEKDKPNRQYTIYHEIGLRPIDTELIKSLLKSNTEFAKRLFEKSVIVQNEYGQIMILYREGNVWMVGVGRFAANSFDIAEARSLYHEAASPMEGFRGRLRPQARGFFRKIGVREDLLENLSKSDGTWHPYLFKDLPPLLVATMLVDVRQFPTVEPILKAFSEGY